MKLEVAKIVYSEIHTLAQEALEAYIKDRIETIYEQIETASLDNVLHLQGRIAELKELRKMRDYATRILEQRKRNG